MTDIPNVSLDSRSDTVMAAPDKIVKVREAFGVDTDLEVPAFSEADERVPDLDPTYVFDPDTMAICAGFAKNRRVMIQGYHGTGKSTHPSRPRRASTGWANPDQPRRAHQPHRPGRSRCDRASRGTASDLKSAKAFYHGRCSIRWRWCSTNMTPAAPT